MPMVVNMDFPWAMVEELTEPLLAFEGHYAILSYFMVFDVKY